MQKRGLLIKTIELVFAAILILVFTGILTNLLISTILGERSVEREDLKRYHAELTSLNRGETIPVRTIHANYTLGLYDRSAQRPDKCKDNACICIYKDLGNANDYNAIACELLPKIQPACTDRISCLATPKTLLNKEIRPEPEIIYFCQDIRGRITITKTESEC